MARHYCARDFFRQMPNHLLARYFHARGVLGDLDIAALPEPQPDALWAAWLTLDDTQRHVMDAAFREIAALSGEKGCRAILDDAAWHFASDPAAHAAFVEQLAALPHHGARAMTTFLDHPACWRRAARFSYAEALSAWREALPAGYDAVSPIRRPRAFARALGTMAAEQASPRGEPSCCGARRPERRSPRPTGGARWASGGSAPFLSHQENRQGRVRRLRHVVRTARRSRAGAGRLRPVLHASLHQVRKGTTGCTTDRDSRLGNLLQRP